MSGTEQRMDSQPAVNPHKAGTSAHGVTLTSNGKRKGRPPKYNNCLDLLADIDDYFDTCDAGRPVYIKDKRGNETAEHRPIPYTIAGLQLHLEMYSDNAVEELSARSEDFSRCVKYARGRIHSQREVGLLDGSSNTIGSIFWLKARAGWRDQPEQAQSGGITVVIEGGSTVKLVSGQAEQKAIDVDYQTVSVALPHTNPHIPADTSSDSE